MKIQIRRHKGFGPIVGLALVNILLNETAFANAKFFLFLIFHTRLSFSFLFLFNPNWHEAGHFLPLVLFGLDFWKLNFIKNFQSFFGGEN